MNFNDFKYVLVVNKPLEKKLFVFCFVTNYKQEQFAKNVSL